MKMESGSTIRFILRSLRHRNYRLFFTGQSLSLIGTWMTQVATSWLIYRVTNSAWLLGFVGCFDFQPPDAMDNARGVCEPLEQRVPRRGVMFEPQVSVVHRPFDATFERDAKEVG